MEEQRVREIVREELKAAARTTATNSPTLELEETTEEERKKYSYMHMWEQSLKEIRSRRIDP